MEPVKVLHHDPFNPILFNSPALEITEEQRQFLWEVYQTGASDSRFAQKMYNATLVILTTGSVEPPVVASLNPATAPLGSANFTLHVTGTGFGPQSKIVWNGGVEPTTFVSEGELTTMVNMDTAQQAVQIPVQVQNENGVLSNSLQFDITAAAGGTQSTQSKPYDKTYAPPVQVKK